MADERSRLEFLKQIENAEARIKRAKDSTVLSQIKINKYIDEQKAKIVALAKELKKANQDTLNEYSSMEQSIGSISGAYGKLRDNQKAALDLAVSDLVKSGHATPHDIVVTDKLAYILTGGDTDFLDKVSEDRLLEMERESFVDLVKTEATLERFEHMLTKGKPLRN